MLTTQLADLADLAGFAGLAGPTGFALLAFGAEDACFVSAEFAAAEFCAERLPFVAERACAAKTAPIENGHKREATGTHCANDEKGQDPVHDV